MPLPETDLSQPSADPGPPVAPVNVVARTLGMGLAGLLGAYLSWITIGAIGEVSKLPADLAGLGFGQVPSPEVQARLAAATLARNCRNSSLWMGATGAILGSLFGIATCVIRKLRMSGIRVLLETVTLGTLFGALAGFIACRIDSIAYQNLELGATKPPEYITLLMHSVTWLTAGLGLGLGIAVGRGKTCRSIMEATLGTALAGMLGGCLFPIVAGLIAPAVNSTYPIPALTPASAQIIWLSLPSVLMGLAIGRSA